jgi:hypothetical protein
MEGLRQVDNQWCTLMPREILIANFCGWPTLEEVNLANGQKPPSAVFSALKLPRKFYSVLSLSGLPKGTISCLSSNFQPFFQQHSDLPERQTKAKYVEL